MDPFLDTPIFRKLMSRNRFEQIWWCLHFNNNELLQQSTNRRKGEILLQSWRDTRVVNMISTIHNSTMVDVPRRNEEVKKKPICIFQCYMFMKGVDRADQYLSYNSLLR